MTSRVDYHAKGQLRGKPLITLQRSASGVLLASYVWGETVPVEPIRFLCTSLQEIQVCLEQPPQRCLLFQATAARTPCDLVCFKKKKTLSKDNMGRGGKEHMVSGLRGGQWVTQRSMAIFSRG